MSGSCPALAHPPAVIPAEAGTQYSTALGHLLWTSRTPGVYWAPAFAGVTIEFGDVAVVLKVIRPPSPTSPTIAKLYQPSVTRG